MTPRARGAASAARSRTVPMFAALAPLLIIVGIEGVAHGVARSALHQGKSTQTVCDLFLSLGLSSYLSVPFCCSHALMLVRFANGATVVCWRRRYSHLSYVSLGLFVFLFFFFFEYLPVSGLALLHCLLLTVIRCKKSGNVGRASLARAK